MTLVAVTRYLAARCPDLTARKDDGEFRITFKLDSILRAFPKMTRQQAIAKAESLAYYCQYTDDAQDTADAMQKTGIAPEQVAAPIVRRDNVEYNAGRDARAAGWLVTDNPYSANGVVVSDSRYDRWTLGWKEGAPTVAAPVNAATTYIDCTPTWAEILPALLLVLEQGDDKGKASMRAELARMAALADERNAMVKAAAIKESVA